MKTKICTKCNIEKELSDFYKDKQKIDGYRPDCKECSKIQIQKYRDNNKEKITKQVKKYYEIHKLKILTQSEKYRDKNKEKIINYKQEYYLKNKESLQYDAHIHYEENKEAILKKNAKWRKENKEKINQNKRNKFATDFNFRLRMNLKSRLVKALKENWKSGNTLELLGCTVKELKQHLESQFTSGMSWDNYGLHGWHIDHKKPCSSFDLSNPEEQCKCFSFTNLQPLWALDNLRKGSKIIN